MSSIGELPLASFQGISHCIPNETVTPANRGFYRLSKNIFSGWPKFHNFLDLGRNSPQIQLKFATASIFNYTKLLLNFGDPKLPFQIVNFSNFSNLHTTFWFYTLELQHIQTYKPPWPKLISPETLLVRKYQGNSCLNQSLQQLSLITFHRYLLDPKWLYSRHSATYFNQLRCILLPNQMINRLPGNITIICAQTSKSLTRDLLHYHTIWDICSSSPAHHSLERSSSYHINCILHHDSSCFSTILSSHHLRHFHGIVNTFRLPLRYYEQRTSIMADIELLDCEAEETMAAGQPTPRTLVVKHRQLHSQLTKLQEQISITRTCLLNMCQQLHVDISVYINEE